MKKYNVSVQCIEAGSQGINMNVQVDANNMVDAIALAQIEVVKTLAASGLQIAPVITDPPVAPA